MLFEDEFSLSNTATVGYQWSLRGCQPKVLCQQARRQRLTGMGTVNPMSGQITVSFHNRGNWKSFRSHLKKLLYLYRNHSCIIVVVDNVPFHHARRLKEWLQAHPQLELVYLPPYSPDF